jgi:hypothetical protein
MIPSRRLHCSAVAMAAVLVVLAALPAAALTVQVAAPAATRAAVAEPHANSPTTITLDLCAGPTATCPASGFVDPGYTPAFSMSYGQGWNGTVIVTAADGLGIPGFIVLTWSYNGGPAQVICILPAQTGGTCPSSVGTTQGTSLGTNTITATYTGDAIHAPSSSTVVITVLQDTTTASLIGTPNPATAGQPVTFTATMTGSNSPPTGPVTFTYGGSVIGTANLVAGAGLDSTASITASTLPVGKDVITATYAGTPDFAGASASFTETITPSLDGSFLLSVSPNLVDVGVGFGTLLSVTVTPQNGFSQDVNLACHNLPPEATCLFVNPTIPGGSGAASLIVQTTAPHSCGTTTPYFLGKNGGRLIPGGRSAPFALPALAGLLAFLIPARRRRWLQLLIAFIAAVGAMQLTGCGNCTDLGTRPATYSIEVTGTAAQGGATASQAVKINVTI